MSQVRILKSFQLDGRDGHGNQVHPLVHLKAGEFYELQGGNNGRNIEGLIVNGKFYPIALSTSIKEGFIKTMENVRPADALIESRRGDCRPE
jgi:hypothetical protein